MVNFENCGQKKNLEKNEREMMQYQWKKSNLNDSRLLIKNHEGQEEEK